MKNWISKNIWRTSLIQHRKKSRYGKTVGKTRNSFSFSVSFFLSIFLYLFFSLFFSKLNILRRVHGELLTAGISFLSSSSRHSLFGLIWQSWFDFLFNYIHPCLFFLHEQSLNYHKFGWIASVYKFNKTAWQLKTFSLQTKIADRICLLIVFLLLTISWLNYFFFAVIFTLKPPANYDDLIQNLYCFLGFFKLFFFVKTSLYQWKIRI